MQRRMNLKRILLSKGCASSRDGRMAIRRRRRKCIRDRVESNARGLLETWRQRLQEAEKAPLHASLGDRARLLSLIHI